jgi:putative transposase
MPAVVLLPDHLHAIWTLPEGDAGYSVRWKRIKEEFTKNFIQAGGEEGPRSDSRLRRQERGIWQRRFWEHTIRDEDDFEEHFNYVHYNPVKHRLVRYPRDWPYSSFHRWVKLGAYPPDWSCLDLGPVNFRNRDESEME